MSADDEGCIANGDLGRREVLLSRIIQFSLRLYFADDRRSEIMRDIEFFHLIKCKKKTSETPSFQGVKKGTITVPLSMLVYVNCLVLWMLDFVDEFEFLLASALEVEFPFYNSGPFIDLTAA